MKISRPDPALTNYLTLGVSSRVTSTNRTVLSFTLSTGALRGSVPDPANPKAKPISFNGVVLQNRNCAYGWFLGGGRSGELYLGQ